MRYDAVVVGAGAAGLVCAAVLAASGRSVAVVERHPYLGGRAMETEFRGHKIGLGSHLVEDPGDSLTRVFELLGLDLVHSERSDAMPFWDRDRWRPIQDFYAGSSRAGLKRCIEAVTQAEYDDFEAWDHASLREWMSRYTTDEGVFLVWEAISMLEQITSNWWEHSASENLFVRKLHYTARRTAGYSFWPMGGWDRLWGDLAGALRDRGGVIRQPEVVDRVLVERGRVVGVRLRAPAGAAAPPETIEAEHVIVNAPVWELPALFDDGVLPWDLSARVQMLAENRNRACWIGYWIAAKEPVIAMTEREMASFFATPRTGLPGFTLNFTGYDPDVSPARGVPDVRRRGVRRHRALRRPGLDRRQVPLAVAGHRGHAPGRPRVPVAQAPPGDRLRGRLQAGAGGRGAPRHAGARHRRPLADRRHHAGARHRHRQGRPLGHHRRRSGAGGSPALLRRHRALLTARRSPWRATTSSSSERVPQG